LAKRTGAVARINISVAALNLGLNLLLIPVLGVQGAAMATVVSALGGFSLNMSASQRHYAAPHDWGRLGAGAVVIGIAVGGLVWLGGRVEPLSTGGIALKLSTALAALSLAAVVVLQRADWATLRALLRRAAR
jgi:peptidoglycan biosynthesis protein MviN/MurJ (putative lipid II flippase)